MEMDKFRDGDLVLVKVLGFIGWPAKICRPKGLERAPDPEKFHVMFFGTEELAFVAPEDIQAFTSEMKSKLSARFPGKAVSVIAQAMEDICTEFEELQRKCSCPPKKQKAFFLCSNDNEGPKTPVHGGISSSSLVPAKRTSLWHHDDNDPTTSIHRGSTSTAAGGDDKMPKVDSDISIKRLIAESPAKTRQGHLQYTHGNSCDSSIINSDVEIGGTTCGSDSAFALDVFKIMVETISRTKENIHRATCFAIDSAKHGIANEVLELLIHELETEPRFRRRVDLFFLVDSIIQCSHRRKGIACASYIPAVQAVLTRLLLAATPQGIGAEENRHQCLKVLRLWIERKILPEPLLRPYVDAIGMLNDDRACELSTSQPIVAELALNDRIREIGGVLLDEYGSNKNFQLLGLLCSNVVEEDEKDLQEVATRALELKHTSATVDNTEKYVVTQTDRHISGELEMKQICGQQSCERPLFTDVPNGNSSNHAYPGRIIQSYSNSYLEFPALPEGLSPPLPPGSPPKTPPLPPLPSVLRVAPPPPPSELHPLDRLPPRPPLLLFSQPSPSSQSSMSLQHLQPVASSITSSLPTTYQEPLVQHEVGSVPSGHQLHTSGNVLYGSTPQPQHPSFFPSAVGHSGLPEVPSTSYVRFQSPNALPIGGQFSGHGMPFNPGVNALYRRPA